ncbi:MAG: hypothetical protein GY820_08085 [Gammaproteobacteria bacterium]|nr:hypothetical protein [Gammaproteobacteria bacterium]
MLTPRVTRLALAFEIEKILIDFHSKRIVLILNGELIDKTGVLNNELAGSLNEYFSPRDN